MLIGRGFGQQDRAACVKLCLFQAVRSGHELEGAVFASDAFFPFAVRPALPAGEKRLRYVPLNLSDRPSLNEITKLFACLDDREGPELLIDAGCVGGIVPADGKRLTEVQQVFASAGLRVAYVPPEFRGFAKH